MLPRNSLIAHLRTFLTFQPRPEWKDRTKVKLVREFRRLYAQPPASRRWAIYATYDDEPVRFAEAVCQMGSEWRPVAIQPERLAVAVAAIEPALVAIDGRVPHPRDLAAAVHSSSAASVAIIATEAAAPSAETPFDLTGFTSDQLSRLLTLATLYRIGHYTGDLRP